MMEQFREDIRGGQLWRFPRRFLGDSRDDSAPRIVWESPMMSDHPTGEDDSNDDSADDSDVVPEAQFAR